MKKEIRKGCLEIRLPSRSSEQRLKRMECLDENEDGLTKKKEIGPRET